MRLEKSLIYKNFYKDLAERYGDECCDYRLLDLRGTDAGTTYTTDISDARWMAYDVPGNIGWMTYLAMLAKMIGDREYGSAAVSAAPAALMIIRGYKMMG